MRRSKQERKRDLRLKEERRYHQKQLKEAQRKLEASKYRIQDHRRDPSTGKKDAIYGMSLTGEKLEKALYPAGTTSEDKEEFVSCLPDVLTMPKGNVQIFNADNTDSSNFIDAMQHLYTKGRKIRRVGARDSTFCTEKRHGLAGLHDSKEAFLKAHINVGEEADALFEQMDNNVREFLSRRDWRRDDINNYLAHGGLMILIKMLHKQYLKLLEHVFRLQVKSGWDSGQARPTLKFHGEKLWKIQRDANTKYNMILRQYVFLRDAIANKFSDPALQDAIWEEVTRLRDIRLNNSTTSSNHQQQRSNSTSNNTNDNKSSSRKSGQCGKCKSRTLHAKIRPKIGEGKENCPFKDESDDIAKKARASLIALGVDEISMNLVKEHIEKAKGNSNSGGSSG